MIEEECEQCAKSSAIYDFNRICCRVRFILSLPTREMRSGWLERWRSRDGKAMADAVEKAVLMKWKTGREDRESGGDRRE